MKKQKLEDGELATSRNIVNYEINVKRPVLELQSKKTLEWTCGGGEDESTEMVACDLQLGFRGLTVVWWHKRK